MDDVMRLAQLLVKQMARLVDSSNRSTDPQSETSSGTVMKIGNDGISIVSIEPEDKA